MEKEYYQKHREAIIKKNGEHVKLPGVRERVMAYQESYRKSHKQQSKEYMKEYYSRQEIKEKKRQEGIERRRKQKELVFNHYSNGVIECGLCPEKRIDCLSIDHIGGGGCKHRKEINRSAGSGFYVWLIQNNFPPGFQVLCMNCNHLLGRKRNGS